MPPTFRERSAGREPSGRFGLDVAEYTRTYVLEEMLADGTSHPIRTQDVAEWIVTLIGGTKPGPSPRPLGAPGGAGSLDRLMPTADPQWPSLFADVPVVRVVPMESYVQDQYGGGLLAIPPTLNFCRYNAVEIDVPYSARPYAVLDNDRMVMAVGDYYDVDGSRKQLKYYPEWVRFVTTFVEDLDTRVNATVNGGMVFRVPSTSGTAPDGSTYDGIPDVVVPDVRYKLRWHGVPIRYLTSSNSYLLRFKGFINQWPFLGKVKGSLLYENAKVVRTYTPPQFDATQQPNSIDGFLGILAGSFYAEPLVDVELSFIFTARRRHASSASPEGLSNDPDAIPNLERPNNNWIDGPHNWFLHWASRRWHYAHASTSPKNTYAKWVPQYPSVPFPILFADPDVPGQVVSI